MKKIVKPLLILLIISLVFTALTAVLPIFPYTLQTDADLKPLKIGFPFTFVEQTLTEDNITSLKERDYTRSFVLPRYDLYDTTFSVVPALLSWLVVFAVFTAVWALCHFFPKYAKKALPFLIIGAVITALFLFLPATPGTFKTEADLDPMTFGFPLKYVEMTPDIDTIILDETLYDYLAQSYIAPRYGIYDTHINYIMMLVSFLLNALMAAIVILGIKFIFKKPKKALDKSKK